jgi:hypothetical protein
VAADEVSSRARGGTAAEDNLQCECRADGDPVNSELKGKDDWDKHGFNFTTTNHGRTMIVSEQSKHLW